MTGRIRWMAWALLTAMLMALTGIVTHALDARIASQSDAAMSASAEPGLNGSPLEQYQTQRQQLRARQKAQLNDIIHDARTDEETVRDARRQLLDMMDAESAEIELQGILRLRGFDEAVVSIWEGTADIMVPGRRPNRQEAAVILDLVLRQTGITGGNVKIIPIN